jgi:hypothetical protein
MQIGHAACVEGFRFESFVVNGSDEDDRQDEAGIAKPTPQLYSRHIAKMNIENQAADLSNKIGFKKRLCRRVSLGLIAVRVQQPFDAPSHARIVFHDSHCPWGAFQIRLLEKLKGTRANGGIVSRANVVGYWPLGKDRMDLELSALPERTPAAPRSTPSRRGTSRPAFP